jgi:hypothetical protein
LYHHNNSSFYGILFLFLVELSPFRVANTVKESTVFITIPLFFKERLNLKPPFSKTSLAGAGGVFSRPYKWPYL